MVAAMPTIRIETWIAAPKETCFDLARSVEAHTASTSKTGERAVAGITTGLMGLGDSVTWEARHFGITQRLTAKITRFERPQFFEDQMVKGAFASFTHVHQFSDSRGGTLMIDTFAYRAPLGFLGRVVDIIVLERYMRRFLVERAKYLKDAAEALRRSMP
jgi:ligand-binding SRPBCC domain-containing protein